jgi:carboxylate-amine ligase
MAGFDDFAATAALLSRAADVPDYTWFWWKLRPHPRLGTVEVRALDVQITSEATAGIAALVHCLARHEADGQPGPDPPVELVEEGLFRAARFGVQARLPDAEGSLRPAAELLDDALQTAMAYADELNCRQALSCLPELLADGGGAGRQRRFYEIAGMDALLRELTRATAKAADRVSHQPTPTPSASAQSGP